MPGQGRCYSMETLQKICDHMRGFKIGVDSSDMIGFCDHRHINRISTPSCGADTINHSCIAACAHARQGGYYNMGILQILYVGACVDKFQI